MDLSCLGDTGLTKGEIKVYTALLELGPSTSGPIIERSGVARSIIYQLLSRLEQKGLVSHAIRQKTKYFQAQEPSSIKEYLDDEQKKFMENRKKVEALLPKLSALSRSAKPSEATVYFGMKGMMTAHEHTYSKLKRGGWYYYMGIAHDQPEHIQAYFVRDHKRRAKAGIKCSLLFNQKTPSKALEIRNSFSGCDARYMPFDIDTPAWFVGYGETVLIGFPYSNSITVEIVNREIAASFLAYFREFWKRSRPFKSKKR